MLRDELERYEPARAPSRESDVLVPLLQAVVSGLLCGGLALLFLVAAGRTFEQAALIGALIGGSIIVAAWFWRVAWSSRTIDKMERLTGRDLDRNGYVGAHPAAVNPGQARATAERVATQEGAAATRQAVLDFLERAYRSGTSEGAMGIGASDRDVYVQMRNLLLRLGVAEWKNPQRPRAGWVLRLRDPAEARAIVLRHVL